MIDKAIYEKYIEETIDGIKDYVRETKGEDWKIYHPWRDTLEILESFRVDMLSLVQEIKDSEEK